MSQRIHIIFQCCDNGDIVQLREILQNDPEAVNEKNILGNYPLHQACQGGQASLEFIQCLVEAFPESICRPGYHFNYPLHYACGIRPLPSIPVLEYLIASYPDALWKPGSYGWYPLNLICRQGAPPRYIQLVQRATFRRKDFEWPQLLRYVCCNDNMQPPHEIAQIQFREGNTALHFVCEARLPFSVLQEVANACPRAIQLFNQGNHLPVDMARKRGILSPKVANVLTRGRPLHFICANGMWIKTMEYVFHLNRRDVSTKWEGLLPLHYLCQRPYHSVLRPAAKFLMEQYPDALCIPTDTLGDLPLHLAIKLNHGVKFLQYLTELYPQAMQVPNKAGDIPLHIAVSHLGKGGYISLASLRLLVQENPQTARATNGCGDLALHMACRCGAPAETLQLLLDLYPRAILIRNPVGYLPLHVAALSPETPVDSLFLLIRNNPETIF